MKEKLLLLQKEQKFWTYLIVASVCVLILCALILGGKYIKRKQAEKVYDDLKEEYVSDESQQEQQVDLGPGGLLTIDFDALQNVNSHVYAWLEVADTSINYPVVQHPESLSYYLNRTIDRKKGLPGTLFSERYTSTTLYDDVHIIYGHNMKNKSMFGALHSYAEDGYLEKHSYMYLYTPSSIYVYRIFAAVVTSNAHFLNKYDFSTPEGKREYLNDIYHPQEMNEKNQYLDGLQVTTNQKILILSTCTSESKKLRYTVHGALIKVINQENNQTK